MSDKAALMSMFIFFMRLLVHEFSSSYLTNFLYLLKLYSKVQAKCEPRITKREKTKQVQNKQIVVNGLVFVASVLNVFS